MTTMKEPETTRRRLPDRRPNETHEIEIGRAHYIVTVGFFPDGRPGEIFIAGGKAGSQIDSILDDAAIALSRCLQANIPAAELARSMSRLPASMFDETATVPASPIAMALDIAAAYERPEVATG